MRDAIAPQEEDARESHSARNSALTFLHYLKRLQGPTFVRRVRIQLRYGFRASIFEVHYAPPPALPRPRSRIPELEKDPLDRHAKLQPARQSS
ncbi:uncharacterized protein SCHCODRAFT_01128122 [Schizophyllum commune H4-8]|nr:uncharacterized protein SCHCODRAFT_01128122 [Schizophyllum commune H4-8]KAI5889922.1 hypothetical protein SCHCODRAFT_01128122 [Schizophyllum commune H4-8]